MKNRFWRFVLARAFSKLHPDLKVFIDEVNAETWLCAQAQTGGHALSVLKPIGEVEAVSIKCVLLGNKSMADGAVQTEDIDYYSKSWEC